jgi:hypothetical protein
MTEPIRTSQPYSLTHSLTHSLIPPTYLPENTVLVSACIDSRSASSILTDAFLDAVWPGDCECRESSDARLSSKLSVLAVAVIPSVLELELDVEVPLILVV